MCISTFIDTHNFTISKVIGTNKEQEMCLPKKEYISGHRWEGKNMVVKWTVHMHITAELKACWLLVKIY